MEDSGGQPDVDLPLHSLQDAWQILELAAIHYPDKLAVVDCGNDTLLTYAELHQRALRLAAWLQRSGVRRGDRVGILARNSSYVMELHFAAAALHAVVVNLNIHLAPAELAYILSDSKPKVTFADRAYAANLVAARTELAKKNKQTPSGGENVDLGTLVWMDIDSSTSSSSSATLPAAGAASPSAFAKKEEQDYASCFSGTFTRTELSSICSETLEHGSIDDGYHMYYTSGTTGRPKGVVLSHRIVVHHAVGTIKEMKLNRNDVWAHLAPMFHLVDVFAVYAITLVGGRHVTYPSFNAVEALLLIERERVTVTNVASTMISMLVNNPLVEQLDLTCLRVISCGGSPQSPAVVTRAIAVFGCEFFLSYGMTECCGKISMSILPEDISGLSVQDQLDLVYSSGRPFSLIDVRVVDDDGKDVAKDGHAVGEVWVRGPTVFDGYFGLPEATKEAFSPEKWFHTGDLATADVNGYIKVVDRKKDMLLVGGENVYTTEVEAVLHAHPAVHQAAVFGVPNRVMGELVAAAVTLVQCAGSGGVAPSAGLSKELIAWCKERLAEYKVPTAVHIIEKFPTTGSGKILKTELRKMFASGGGATGAAVPAGVAAAPLPATRPTKLSCKQLADKLSQHCGGSSDVAPVLCHAVDAELGKDMGKDLLPDASYLILLTPDDLKGDVAARMKSICNGHNSVKHAVVVVLERPQPRVLAAFATVQNELGVHLALLHIPESEFHMGSSATIRTALAAAKAEMPPLAAVLYWKDEKESTPQQTAAAAAAAAAPTTATTVAPVKKKPAGPSPDQVSKRVLSALSGLVSTDAASRIASGDPLMASGVTSTLAVQLVSALESSFGTQLPGTLVFDYPSLPEMTEFLVSELQTEVQVEAVAPSASVRGAALPVVSRHLPFSSSPPPPSLQITKPSVTTSSKNIVSTITQQVGELVGRADVDPATPLMAAGVTSTLAVQLVSALEAALGTELPGTLVFDYPTVNEMADFVAELVGADSASATAKVEQQPAATLLAPSLPPSVTAIERPVCVITASACAAPGGSLAPQATKGNDRITLVPLERWDVGPPPADAAAELNLQFGSFLPNVAMFDPGMFGISPAEALLMDPQQRLVMHTFSEAMAGHLLGRVSVRETGVFVGVSQLDYARTAYETGSALNTYYATGSHLSVTSGRLSYTHGFKGPALTVDTACSSSLVTTHLAGRSLYEGECRVAGSIGVNLTLVHSWTRACLRAGMLAEDGHCKTMDASAGKI